MNDPQESTLWQSNGFRDLFGIGDSGDFEDVPLATGPTAGLVSLGFIASALGRGMRVWLAVAAIGFIVGAGLAVEHQPAHTATTTVLIANSSAQGGAQGAALITDIDIVESIPVATAVVAQLKIPETPSTFLQTYSAAPLGQSTQIMAITAKGPSDDAAVQRASAIAGQFLAFYARYLQAQLQQSINALHQEVQQAQQNLNAINQRFAKVSAEPVSPSQAAELGGLPKEQTDAEQTLSTAQQNAITTRLQEQTTTAQLVQGSQVLSPAAPGHRSVKKNLVLYTIGGLVGGLVIGMAIVVIGAISSDKLRRRDDIAIAVGAPVRLSVGRLHRRRWMPDRRKGSGQRNRDMERVVEHLRSSVPAGSKGAASLAVVAVDDASTVAQATVRLAIASSQQRKRVLLADLSAGAVAARQLGVTAPGIGKVSPEGVAIMVLVPDREDIAPVGPLPNSSLVSAKVDESLAQAAAQADLVLSLVTLNPAFSSDYLKTWATDAVAVITAGESTATRINATGELVRLAGTRLRSVIVLDADKNDESLGAVTALYQPPSTVRA